MTLTTPTPQTFALLASIVFVLAAILACAWLGAHRHRSARRDNARLFEQTDLALSGLRELTECMAALETKFGELARRLESGLPVPAASATAIAPARNYEVAVRLARSGASAAEIEASCGLTAHEAELLARLHGLRKSLTPVRSAAHLAAIPTQPGKCTADMSYT